jgi:hypothetical protein
MKECVLSDDLGGGGSELTNEPTSDQFPIVTFVATTYLSATAFLSLDIPILLHLAHPQALNGIRVAVSHVHRFWNYLKSLSPAGESATIAKDMLIDLVDCSGVDLTCLDPLLDPSSSSIDEISGVCFVGNPKHFAYSFSAEDARRNLAICKPTPSSMTLLRKMIQQINTSKVLNKARLFIKPFELVDGMGRLSIDAPRKEKERDVISKAILPKRGLGLTCLRCGGQYEMQRSPSSLRWYGWEKLWMKRCVCGGVWLRQAPV